MIVPAKWHHNPSTQRQSSAYSSAQRQSSAYPSTHRQLSACPIWNVGDVLYGGSWGLDCQVGTSKGHSPHRGSDGVHVSNPMASSCTMQLVHVTSLKPGGVATSCVASRGLGDDVDSCLVPSTCWHSSALWH